MISATESILEQGCNKEQKIESPKRQGTFLYHLVLCETAFEISKGLGQ